MSEQGAKEHTHESVDIDAAILELQIALHGVIDKLGPILQLSMYGRGVRGDKEYGHQELPEK